MNRLGKRYHCETCGTLVLCLKAGTQPIECCGQVMNEVEMQELPSGD